MGCLTNEMGGGILSSPSTSDSVKTSSSVRELKVPTFKELFEIYPIIAEEQRQRTGGRPSVTLSRMRMRDVKRCLTVLGWDHNRPYTDLTGKQLDWLFSYFKDYGGHEPITAKQYVESIRSVCASWTHFRYEQYGYKVTSVKVPNLYLPPIRYREKSAELRKKTSEWYNGIYDKDIEVWFLATMMLQFGMRNRDVWRLTWDNFIREADGIYLKYMPNKTKLTSGRIVHWPVSDNTLPLINQYKESHFIAPFVPSTNETSMSEKEVSFVKNMQFVRAEERLCKHMRNLGFNGSKAAYELRKLCASMVYKNFGQEAASSITGDDIRTVLKYYADPASVSKKIDITSLM